MCASVDVIASRGERLELLVDKTEDLSNSVCMCWFLRIHSIPADV